MKKVYLSIGILVAAVFVVAFAYSVRNSYGSAPSGLPSTLITATSTQVGPSKFATENTKTLIEANTQCTSRVISTTGQPILLSFGNPQFYGVNEVASTTINGAIGHWQAASTTIAYDSGLYGCGKVNAWSYATSTVTISSFR